MNIKVCLHTGGGDILTEGRYYSRSIITKNSSEEQSQKIEYGMNFAPSITFPFF